MSEKKCEMCHPGMPILNEDEINESIKTLNDWAVDFEQGLLFKTFQFKGYYKTMAFVNAVAWIAHQQGHHPDMTVRYNQVTINYTTHEAGGITVNDMICAQLVDALL